MERSCGILMPISSLPSKYGIGTFGKQAYKFIDFLYSANQKYWQILPIGPISYGDSPYSSFSAYAGNPYFIDFDLLVEDKLLSKYSLRNIKIEDKHYIDYSYLYNTRYKILYKAYKKGYLRDLDKVEAFVKKNNWVNDYALFMSIKKHFDMKSWVEWPDQDIRLRKKEAIAKYKKLLDDEIKFQIYMQYLFFKQFNELKKYMNMYNISLIGDIPIYVSLDSSDCWANPKCFKLDENNIPEEVSGVPPDYFNADGQLWGNPLYDWDYHKKTNYDWWIDRLNYAGRIYDIVRIDHFRGFESYWAVPYGNTTAKIGRWVDGPGDDLINAIKRNCKDIEFISEDLGYHTDKVQALLDNFGYPGMKVLIFSFDTYDDDLDKPHNFVTNSVCYTGTHDNDTEIGWFNKLDEEKQKYIKEYIKLKENEKLNWALIRVCLESNSTLFVAPIQDYLGLDSSARINTPGTMGENWKWRVDKKQLTASLAKKIARYCKKYNRT